MQFTCGCDCISISPLSYAVEQANGCGLFSYGARSLLWHVLIIEGSITIVQLSCYRMTGNFDESLQWLSASKNTSCVLIEHVHTCDRRCL